MLSVGLGAETGLSGPAPPSLFPHGTGPTRTGPHGDRTGPQTHTVTPKGTGAHWARAEGLWKVSEPQVQVGDLKW